MAGSSPGEPPAVQHLVCPKCGHQMLIVRIEPDTLNHSKRTFECSECGRTESIVVKRR